jgi:L-ribulose-5-phosphate 3-epimerase
METVTRRTFVKAVAAAGATMASSHDLFASQANPAFRGTVCFFSKHFPLMDAKRLGRTLKTLGFGGVDLTVRPKGHIEPARVAADLPPFVAGIRAEGIAVPMITTDLHSDSEPAARPTLETAARLEIPYFKTGYYYYKFADVKKELDTAARQLRSLAELSARCGVKLGFHNHSGYVGGPVWDIAPTIESLDPKWSGYYFDVRHAVVEGGDAGWRTAFNLAAPRLFMIAVKDVYWEKTAKGWRQHNCPLGEGMVDWKRYFRMLADAKFHGPLSLHLEYDVPGATPEAQEASTIAAATKDLAFIKAHLAEAYGGTGSGA